MNTLWQFAVAHQLGIFWAFSAAVGTMPAPTATSGVAYAWAFRFFNVIAANVARGLNTKVETSPNFQAAVKLAEK